jgi:uncharacterized coiled-coil protein SlyX
MGESGKTVEELELIVIQQAQQIRMIRDRLKLMSKFLNEEIRKI